VDSVAESGSDLVALDCFAFDDNSRIVLCYNTMGIIMQVGNSKKDIKDIKTESYLIWQSTAVKFGLISPNLIVYGKGFIEIYDVFTGQLTFFTVAPGCRALDTARQYFCLSETETGEVLSRLKPNHVAVSKMSIADK
jgi:hypothetical protein